MSEKTKRDRDADWVARAFDSAAASGERIVDVLGMDLCREIAAMKTSHLIVYMTDYDELDSLLSKRTTYVAASRERRAVILGCALLVIGELLDIRVPVQGEQP